MNDLDRYKDGNKLRIAIWDIETTGLNADYGYILCVGILNFVTGKIDLIRIDDKENPDKTSDKWVIQKAIKILNSFDLLVGWYTIRFDHPFLDTRAAKYGLEFQKRNFRRDLWFTSRNRLKLRSNRLGIVGQFLFKQTLKDSITPEVWNGAIRGDKKALNYVANHCRKDLKETERVYRRFMPLFPDKLRRS